MKPLWDCVLKSFLDVERGRDLVLRLKSDLQRPSHSMEEMEYKLERLLALPGSCAVCARRGVRFTLHLGALCES